MSSLHIMIKIRKWDKSSYRCLCSTRRIKKKNRRRNEMWDHIYLLPLSKMDLKSTQNTKVICMLFYNNDFFYSPISTNTHFGTTFRHLTVTEFIYFLFLFFTVIYSDITRKTIPTALIFWP